MSSICKFTAVILAVFCLAAAGCGQEVVLDVSAPDEYEETAQEAVSEEGAQTAEKSSSVILVHVCGAVKSPGVYELPEGSRIYEAVEAAGGFAAGAAEDYLNLAGVLSDGDKVTVPLESELSEAELYGEETKEDGLVNINSADKDLLMTLPGIGEAKAEAIISYREENGPFAQEEDIMLVSGIKEAAYEKLKDRITVK